MELTIKTILLTLTLVVMAFSQADCQIDSVWIGKSPEPCDNIRDTCQKSSGWIGPKADTIRGIYADPNCHPDCYFVVVYYDKFDTLKYECYTEEQEHFNPNEEINYYPFISGIYWFGDDDCYECKTTDIEDYFVEQFYAKAEEEMPGLMNALTLAYLVSDTDTLRNFHEGYDGYFYTNGKCLDSNGLPCEPEHRVCCSVGIAVHSSAADTSNRQIDSLTRWANDGGADPKCIKPCIEDCGTKKQSLMSGLTTCDIPCNEGLWRADSSEVITIDSLLDGCSDCTIKIYYSYRNNYGPTCPNEYKDARFDSVSYDCDPGCITQLSIEELTSYVNDWLLKYSQLNDLLNGQCRDNYRLLNAVCVAGYDTLTQTALADCNPSAPYQLGCCWGRYLVCRSLDDKLTATKIDGTNQIGDTCEFYTRPCVPVCEGINNSIITNPEDPYGPGSFEDIYRSMESMEKAESLVITTVSESKNLSNRVGQNNEIIIYDLYGKVRGNKNSLRTAFDNLERGVYFITEKNKENVLKLYKIYIEK